MEIIATTNWQREEIDLTGLNLRDVSELMVIVFTKSLGHGTIWISEVILEAEPHETIHA